LEDEAAKAAAAETAAAASAMAAKEKAIAEAEAAKKQAKELETSKKKEVADAAFAAEMLKKREDKKQAAEKEARLKKLQEEHEEKMKIEAEKKKKLDRERAEKAENQKKIDAHLARVREETGPPKSFPEAFHSLKTGCDSTQFETAVRYLQGIVSRVVSAPTNPANRMANLEPLGSLPGGMAMMRSLGFVINPANPSTLNMTPTEALWETYQAANRTLTEELNQFTATGENIAPETLPAATPTPPILPNIPENPLSGAGVSADTMNDMSGMGGMGGMMNNPMMQQMMQDPAFQAQMQQSMQQMIANPGAMQGMLQQMGLGGNPAMAQQMQTMMSDPNTMNMIQQMMANPQMMGGMGGMGGVNPAMMQQMMQSMGAPGAPVVPPNTSSPGERTEEEMVQEAIRLSLGQESSSPTPAASASPTTPATGARVINTKPEFDAALQEDGNRLVCVNFSATWCPPCQRMVPVYAALALEYPDVLFLKVDVDANPATKEACGITSMPTYQFYKKGVKVSEFAGANEPRIRSTIAEFNTKG